VKLFRNNGMCVGIPNVTYGTGTSDVFTAENSRVSVDG